MRFNSFLLSIFTVYCSNDFIRSSEVPRPRGVAISKAPFYEVGKDFHCLDGSLSIPYDSVNDDYCDCRDGTDEPGTSACSNGYFHCTNAGFRPLTIKSHKVNDGICDCCDTSDEYNSSVQCINNCKELLKLSKEKEAAVIENMKAGYAKKLEMCAAGKQKKDDIKKKLLELEKEKEEAQRIKAQKEEIKNEIETREKDVLEQHKAKEEELKKKQQEEDMARYLVVEKEQATSAFRLLDRNNDGQLHFTELLDDLRFDQDRNGEVSESEAKFFLHMKDYLELEEYTTTGWMIMKPIISAIPVDENEPKESDKAVDPTEQPYSDVETEINPPSNPTEPHSSDFDNETPPTHEQDDYDGADEVDDEEDLDTAGEVCEEGSEGCINGKRQRNVENVTQEDNHEDTQYDEETQKIIDEAKKVRDEFDEADRKVRDIERELNEINDKINRDYGPDSEFLSMQDECYEYHNDEYIYKLCPFNRASQASKSGGGDTSLGKWGHWSGPEDNKYSRMKFEGGQGCWNGPARSTEVVLSCGTENKLKAVSEPNRCFYMFEFETPASCQKPPTSSDSHDEL